MTIRHLLVACALFICIGLCAYAGPAQDVLSDLAKAERTERVVTGIATMTVGVAVGVASGLFLMGSDLGVYGVLAGGAIAVPGVALLFFLSPSEREFAESGGSEAGAALALARLADQGRRERLLSAVGHLAAGVAALLYPLNVVTPYDYVASAMSSFGTAIYDLAVPSPEEAAYERYTVLARQMI